MNTYRPRLAEIRAADCGDGRYVLLTDPPRYMGAAEFEAAFELVPEQRAVERRQSNGKGKRPKGKKERRKPAQSVRRMKAAELWKEGKDPKEIAKKVGCHIASIGYWKKVDKWPEHSNGNGKPHVPAGTAARRATQVAKAASENNHDGGWME